MRMAVKSLVWVPKGPWEDAGYTTEPQTVQELEGIGDEIKADGIAPWCMGWESGAATGWVGTDWIEEFMLRVNGPDVYDQWVKHEIPFNDPQVAAAFALAHARNIASAKHPEAVDEDDSVPRPGEEL